MAIVQDLIVSVRNLRAELKVEQKQKVPIQVYTQDAKIKTLLEENQGAIERLAGVAGVTFVENSLAQMAGARSTARFDVHVIYEKKIDVAAERQRLPRNWSRSRRRLPIAPVNWGTNNFWLKLRPKWWKACESGWRNCRYCRGRSGTALTS